ncbi:MAG: hypothetical protein K0B16_05690 [Burkholderiaceae bacterium]|nr:hypothetical protein [Burkholderiaceae bacterium]
MIGKLPTEIADRNSCFGVRTAGFGHVQWGMPLVHQRSRVAALPYAGVDSYLGASYSNKGDFLIEGQDIGDGVETVYGCREYEWFWTINYSDLPKLAMR